MPRHRTSASATYAVPAAAVYAVLADYRDGHPRILPPRYFRDLRVERGGYGAGTLIRFAMRAFGRTRHERASISEPEPGRVLVETGLDSGVVTTFTVEPHPGGCTVTIATEITVRRGIAGALERRLVTRLLSRVYAEELKLLGDVAPAWHAPEDGWSVPVRPRESALL